MLRSVIVRRSPIHGNGVFAARKLPAGHRVIQYRGTLVTHDEADDLYEGSVESGHTFLFTLNDEYIVDANRKGNAARWINHSCTPNCQPVVVEDKNGERSRDRIFIETLRPLRAGEELTYDYGITLDVRHTRRLKELWGCRCGMEACTGTMLKLKPKAVRK
ncbi:MAG: SET domain-containing protein [Panacagrimonas sp.]